MAKKLLTEMKTRELNDAVVNMLDKTLSFSANINYRINKSVETQQSEKKVCIACRAARVTKSNIGVEYEYHHYFATIRHKPDLLKKLSGDDNSLENNYHAVVLALITPSASVMWWVCEVKNIPLGSQAVSVMCDENGKPEFGGLWGKYITTTAGMIVSLRQISASLRA